MEEATPLKEEHFRGSFKVYRPNNEAGPTTLNVPSVVISAIFLVASFDILVSEKMSA